MDDFRQLAKIFKKEFPEYKVSIRRVKMADGDAGECNKLSKDKFLIKVNKKTNHDEQLLWLLHEVAHMLSWEHKGDDHSIHWGKAYAKCYKIYLEKFVEDEPKE
jgi:hypothetical protein